MDNLAYLPDELKRLRTLESDLEWERQDASAVKAQRKQVEQHIADGQLWQPNF